MATLYLGEPYSIEEQAWLLAKNANEALEAASSPDHKLAVLANYGDLAIQIIPRLAREIECLRLLIPESEPSRVKKG